MDEKITPCLDDEQFRRLLDFLGLSWQGYRKVRRGVKKRVVRHMQALGCRNLQAYLACLQGSVEAREENERAMAVSISRFFRDRKLWEILEKEALPELIQAVRGPLSVWSCGCAGGEEVYSLKILWHRLGLSVGGLPELRVKATDLQPHNLERAREALYLPSSLKEVPEGLRRTCFQEERGGRAFRLQPWLTDGITWLRCDVFSGPPGSGFHIILLRNNLLTYYRPDRAEPVLRRILGALSPGGFLVIGSHEKLPFSSPDFTPHPVASFVFRKSRAPL